MTVLAIVQLICEGDDCDAVYDAPGDVIAFARTIRASAARKGWQVRRVGRQKDLCPTCRPPAPTGDSQGGNHV